MKRKTVFLATVLTAVLLSVETIPGIKTSKADGQLPGESVVVFTNDVHCGGDDGPDYSRVALVAEAYRSEGKDVMTVDCGDHIQGGVWGSLTGGEAPIKLMDAAGYDLAVPGNHEFDFGMDAFLNFAGSTKFKYISCNFSKFDGTLVFDPYVIRELGGKKIAFLGICTPETFIKSRPEYFCNENGDLLYSFEQDESGQKLYDCINKYAAMARSEGAEIVVALAHLGVDAASSPWTAGEVINNTTGIDVLLDGHSHSVYEQEDIKNKDGKAVLYSQTGTKLQNIGVLYIHSNGTMQTKLLNADNVDTEYNSLKKSLEESLNQVVAVSDVDLLSKQDNIQIVRLEETNIGDLVADAFRCYLETDVGLCNAGSIRADIPKGNITSAGLVSVLPYMNNILSIECTGQQLKDALEMSVSKLPDETGGFLQVSGITFDVDMKVPSPVQFDENGFFVSADGEARVKNIKVNGIPLDLERTYSVSLPDYIFISHGDGYTMFDGCRVLKNNGDLNRDLLQNYLVRQLGGVVGTEYEDIDGQGRINIME